MLARSQADSIRSPHHHMIGLSVSMMSGYGLTYGYIFDGHNVVKAKAFAFQLKDASGTQTNDDRYLEFGIEYQQSFDSRSTPRWYFLAGAFYSLHWSYHKSFIESQFLDYTKLFKRYGGGIGVGIEFSFLHRVLANLDIGVTIIDDNQDQYRNGGYVGDYYIEVPYVGPAAGIGLMYNF